MARFHRLRRHIHRPYCPWCCGPHHYYGPYGPPPWWREMPEPEEEKEEIREHIEMLKEELKAAENYLKELEKAK